MNIVKSKLTFKEALDLGRSYLLDAKIETANLDSRVLLTHACGITFEEILSVSDCHINDKPLKTYLKFLKLRRKHIPIAYILGVKEFYGRDFIVNKHVLIPRPDTETLIEAVISECGRDREYSLLELGSGSGCIVITLCLEMGISRALAIDISKRALEVAHLNAKKWELTSKVNFIHSNWFNKAYGQKFDIIVSNPPYICESEELIMSKDTFFEPKRALFAHDQGCHAYKVLAKKGADFLNENGKIFVEIAYNKKQIIQDIFYQQDFVLTNEYKDLGGNERVLCFMKK